MSSCGQKCCMCFINCCFGCFCVKTKGFEKLPKPEDNGKGFFGLQALDTDGNVIDFEKDLKDKYKAFLIVNTASEWGLSADNFKQLVELDETLGPKG